MKNIHYEVKDHQIVREQSFLKAIRERNGTYRADIYQTNKRSMKQNRYIHLLFSLVLQGLRDNGYREIKTTEDAKNVCKELFLSYQIENGTGGKIKMVKRTRDLSRDEMGEFIDEIIQWAAEYLSVAIPPPNTQMDFFNQ